MRVIHLIHDAYVTPLGWRVEEIDGRRRGASKAESQRLTTSPGAVVADNRNGLPPTCAIQACLVPGTYLSRQP
jgi:hypothetical protein